MSTVSLFLGLFPDHYSATQLTYLANSQRAKHRMRGTPLAESRFHVTLQGWDYDGPALEDLVRDISLAAEEAAGPVPPFEVNFDRVANFGGGALVLRSHGGNAALQQFRDRLRTALARCGVRCGPPNFEPHVTLLYNDRKVCEETVERVSWVVNEFVLVRSFVGRTEYRLLDRWRLRG